MNTQLSLLVSEFVKAIPHLISAILILLVGYIIAKILQTISERLLHRARLDRFIHSSPGGDTIRQVSPRPSHLVGRIVYWLVMLGAISVAVSALGNSTLTGFVAAIYAYIPNVVAAVLILLAAVAISAGLTKVATSMMGGSPSARLLTWLIPGIVFSIAIFMALSQLRIAPNIVTITYAAIMGSVALGSALAFGLGGRDLAAQILKQAHSQVISPSQAKTEPATDAAAATQTEPQPSADQPAAAPAGPNLQPAPSFGETVTGLSGKPNKKTRRQNR